MFQEDASDFMGDFAVPCAKGSIRFDGILDEPDNDIGFSGGAGAVSTDYSLTYITHTVSFKRDDAVIVDGVNYIARGVGERQDDGVFSKVMLQK